MVVSTNMSEDAYKEICEYLDKENTRLTQLVEDLRDTIDSIRDRGDYRCDGCEGWFRSTKLSWQGVNGWRCQNCQKLKNLNLKP